VKTDRGESKPVRFSLRIFQRLLIAYPKAHRQEYGREMAQVFHVQCQDAWHQASGWGLVALWSRVLPDLVKTSVLEHIAAIKGRKLMNKKTIFFAVSMTVFLLVMGAATLVTLILPEVYASKARIKMQNNATGVYDPYFVQTEFAVIQSEVILDPVIDHLDLNTKWAKKFHMEGKLKTAESRAMLKGQLELRPERNTSLVDITVYSDDKAEAAEIANVVAAVYRDYLQAQRKDLMRNGVAGSEKEPAKANETARIKKVSQPDLAAASVPVMEIIDHAMPGLRPVRPNVPLNLCLGAVMGMFAALVVGGVAALLAGIFFRRKPATV